MTEKEQKRLNDLLAKKEREEKADKEFFSQVKKRRAEVLKVLGVKDYGAELQEIAAMYGATVPDLLQYIKSDQQVGFYKRTH